LITFKKVAHFARGG